MKRITSVFHADPPDPARVGLPDLERETRRLLAEHARDPLTRLAIAFDSQLRRLARRVAACLRAPGHTSSTALH